MKKLFTLAAAGALTAASLGAQAQAPIAIDGQLTATEIAANGYQLVGRYTGPRPAGFGDAGLLSMYAASDANNIYFFVAGTLENGSAGISNSIQLFVNRVGGTGGVPVGTALPAAPDPTGVTGNAFSGMTARLDLRGDLGVAIRGNSTANQYVVDAVAYTSATAATTARLSGAAALTANGTSATVPAAAASGALAGFAGAVVAYRSSANLSSNPGFASQGGATSNGLEMSVSRSAMGLPASGGSVQVFAVQNNPTGSFLSTDFIPQPNPLPAAPANLGAAGSVNFATVPGTQAATLQIGAANLTVLGNKAAEAAVALGVYPNPAQDVATVSYRVQGRSQAVRVELVDLMGRTVRVLHDATEAAGNQSLRFSKEDMAAGTYMVKVQVGDDIVARRVVLM